MSRADSFLASIEDIIHFAKDKAIFDVQCRVNSEMDKLRSARYSEQSEISGTITRELALTRFKLDRLRQKVHGLPEEYHALIIPLIDKYQQRINDMRKKRNNI